MKSSVQQYVELADTIKKQLDTLQTSSALQSLSITGSLPDYTFSLPPTTLSETAKAALDSLNELSPKMQEYSSKWDSISQMIKETSQYSKDYTLSLYAATAIDSLFPLQRFKTISPVDEIVVKRNNSPSPETIPDTKDIDGVRSIIHQLTKSEILDFRETLISYPMIALKHKVGKALFDYFKKNWQRLPNVKTIQNQVFYRGRKQLTEQHDFSIDEMMAPDFSHSIYENRFSGKMCNALYVGDSYDTILKEINDGNKDETKLQIITLKPIRTMNLWDVSQCGETIFSFCSFPVTNNDLKIEYLIPNFIAQCILYLNGKKGAYIDGIQYKSAKLDNHYCAVFYNKTKTDFDTHFYG